MGLPVHYPLLQIDKGQLDGYGYLVRLTVSAAIAAEAALTAHLITCLYAKVNSQVQSQHWSFPYFDADIVMASPSLPSSLERPGGSSTHESPDI